jgi:outer membrane protein OmpA-like peptidoglycan-associated protein
MAQGIVFGLGASIRLVLSAAAIALAAAPAVAQSACPALVKAFDEAVARKDFQQTVASARAVIAEISCAPATKNAVERKTALAHLLEAERIPDTPANAAKALQLLEAGMRFAHPWQLMAAIGDLRKQVPNAAGQVDFKGASLAYQDALIDIADVTNVPNPPPDKFIERLIRLAQQDRLAATEFLRGDVLMTGEVRGVVVESVAIPIQFVRGRTDMTAEGRQYADDMLRILRDRRMPRIQLVGHTDPDGGDHYNLDLSMRRAQAVKSFLVAQGYPAASIEVDGRGWHERLRIEDEKNYPKDAVYQMLRRVELKFRDRS